MTILVAPLNWGLGHASRCVPLVRKFLNEGHEVILGGDGESLTLLRRHFPKLRYVYLAPLNLHYSSGKSQVWAMLKALPQLVTWSIKDHAILQSVLKEEPIDRVISDNRFGLFLNHQSPITNHQCECIYITHQLHIMLPKAWKWAEKIAERLHARIYKRFDTVWVPDYDDSQHCLGGELSHPIHLPLSHLPCTIEYIGALSRFQNTQISQNTQNTPIYDIVAVLSGLEPQRTILEQEIVHRYAGQAEKVLIVQGLMHRPNTRFKRGNIIIVPSMGDDELAAALRNAKHIIARSGYSTIMDLEALGLLNPTIDNQPSKIELIPTPGQPEQEYLAVLHSKK